MGVGGGRSSNRGELPLKIYRYAGWYVNKKIALKTNTSVMTGGEGGIRTHGTVTRTPDFESGTFDHSATSP